MKHCDPFKQFLKDSGVKVSKSMLVYGLPFNTDTYKVRKSSKTTANSKIPNKF